MKELAERINDATGNKTPIALTPARDWDRSGQRFAATAKAKEKLGFAATVSHEDGIRRTVAWTKDNKSVILRCMMQHAHYLPDVKTYSAKS